MDFLVVYFDEAASYEVCFRGVIFGDGDDLAEGAGDYTAGLLCVSSHHRMGLAATRLSVREDGAVVAV